MILIYSLLFLIIYFLPLLIASFRELAQKKINSIGTFNFWLGWTGVGWVICLLWALLATPKKTRKKKNNIKDNGDIEKDKESLKDGYLDPENEVDGKPVQKRATIVDTMYRGTDGYRVFWIDNKNYYTDITAVGYIPEIDKIKCNIRIGTKIKIEGYWERHEKWGMQIRFDKIIIRPGSKTAIKAGYDLIDNKYEILKKSYYITGKIIEIRERYQDNMASFRIKKGRNNLKVHGILPANFEIRKGLTVTCQGELRFYPKYGVDLKFNDISLVTEEDFKIH